MRTSRWLLATALATLLVTPFACSDDAGNNSDIQCDDGRDNDGDGTKDYPGDPSCDSALDLTEDGLVSPQCKDETDNDGDGKTDYPNDPGCFAPQQDSEDDECPSGAACPQCSNGKDDDMNGSTDFPSDSGGCTAGTRTGVAEAGRTPSSARRAGCEWEAERPGLRPNGGGASHGDGSGRELEPAARAGGEGTSEDPEAT